MVTFGDQIIPESGGLKMVIYGGQRIAESIGLTTTIFTDRRKNCLGTINEVVGDMNDIRCFNVYHVTILSLIPR